MMRKRPCDSSKMYLSIYTSGKIAMIIYNTKIHHAKSL